MSYVPSKPGCPLCYLNGLLEGGEVLDVGEFWYCYIFRDKQGNVIKAMINPIGHIADVSALISDGSWEFFAMWDHIKKDVIPLSDFNLYSNQGGLGSPTEGRVAGALITDHLHVNVTPRAAGQPSSDMGLARLVERFDELVRAVATISAYYSDQPVADQIIEALKEATKK